MPVIAILNTKGGSGKTTLATNLAYALKKTSGYDVTLVDSDPQGSARDWHEAGGKEILPVVGMDRPSLDRELRSAVKDDDWVIIDGAPQVNELAAAAIKAADVVLIPIQPSPYDIWAAKPVVDAIKARQKQGQGLPRSAIIISRAIVGTALAKDVREALTSYGITIFEAMTHQRVLYAETAATGQTVVEDSNTKAALEIDAIRKELEGYIHG
ncbi:MAG: ParA family partition ATPase [Pseudomonadota bacterium]|nr:ParA family partition ATPase [Pseudomonadota bacterium]